MSVNILHIDRWVLQGLIEASKNHFLIEMSVVGIHFISNTPPVSSIIPNVADPHFKEPVVWILYYKSMFSQPFICCTHNDIGRHTLKGRACWVDWWHLCDTNVCNVHVYLQFKHSTKKDIYIRISSLYNGSSFFIA